MAKQKIESQESKYEKAQSALASFSEIASSNIENSTFKRLPQDKIQNVKKYYFEEYRHFVKFEYLFFALLASLFIFEINSGSNPYFGDDTYFYFSAVGSMILWLRYSYDDGISTRVFIEKLMGAFRLDDEVAKEIELINPNNGTAENQVFDYLEMKIFLKKTTIKYKAYVILWLIMSFILFVGYFLQEPMFLGVLPLLAVVCLFDKPFVQIKKFRRKKRKNDNK